MAGAGTKSGFKGVHANNGKWKPQLVYLGKPFCPPTVERPEDAARWYDRAVYKLRGESEGLNFPLSDETRAQLDAMSVAEFLAEVQVEKEKTKWKNSTAGGTSRFYGVGYDKGIKAWEAKVEQKRFRRIPSEKRAADMADSILLEIHGPKAMTNAKYHSGEEGRERAWQELKEKFRHDIEAGIDVSGRKAKADKVGQTAPATKNPAKARKCRAKPKGRRKRQASSSEDEDDVASSSEEEDQWQSSAEDSSSEDLDLPDSSSHGGSFSSNADVGGADSSDHSQEGGVDGHASLENDSPPSSSSARFSGSSSSEDATSEDTGSDSEASESGESQEALGSSEGSEGSSSFESEESESAEDLRSDDSDTPLTSLERAMHIRGEVPHCRYYQGPLPASAEGNEDELDEACAWGLNKGPELDLGAMFPLTFSRTGHPEAPPHEEDCCVPNPKWQHQTEQGKLRQRRAQLQSLERFLSNQAMLADLGLVVRPPGMTDLQLLKKFDISPELVLPHKRASVTAELAEEANAAKLQGQRPDIANNKPGCNAQAMEGLGSENQPAAFSGGSGGSVNAQTALPIKKEALLHADKAGGVTWEAIGVPAGSSLRSPWLGQPCSTGNGGLSGKKGWGFNGSYATWQAELERFDRWTGTKTDLEGRAAGFKSGDYNQEEGQLGAEGHHSISSLGSPSALNGATGEDGQSAVDGCRFKAPGGSQSIPDSGAAMVQGQNNAEGCRSEASGASQSILDRAQAMVQMGRAALGKYSKVRSDLALDLLEEFLAACHDARLLEMQEDCLDDEDDASDDVDKGGDDVSSSSHGKSDASAGSCPERIDRRKVQEQGAKMLELGRATLAQFYGGHRTIGMDLIEECLRGHAAGVDYGTPGRLYALVQELKYSEDDYLVPGSAETPGLAEDAGNPAVSPVGEAEGEYLRLDYGLNAEAGGYGSPGASAELADDFAAICKTLFTGLHTLGPTAGAAPPPSIRSPEGPNRSGEQAPQMQPSHGPKSDSLPASKDFEKGPASLTANCSAVPAPQGLASPVPVYINADGNAGTGLAGPEALLERMRAMLEGSAGAAILKPDLAAAGTKRAAPSPTVSYGTGHASSATCTDGGGVNPPWGDAATGIRGGAVAVAVSSCSGRALVGSGISTKELAARLKAKMFGAGGARAGGGAGSCAEGGAGACAGGGAGACSGGGAGARVGLGPGARAKGGARPGKIVKAVGTVSPLACSCPAAQASTPAAAAAAPGHAARTSSFLQPGGIPHAGPSVCPLGARTSDAYTPNGKAPAGPYIPVSVAIATQGRPPYLDRGGFAGAGSALGKRGADGSVKEPKQQHGTGWRSKPPAPAPPRRRPLLGDLPAVRNNGL